MKIHNFASDYRRAMELKKAQKMEIPPVKHPITENTNDTNQIPSGRVTPDTSASKEVATKEAEAEDSKETTEREESYTAKGKKKKI